MKVALLAAALMALSGCAGATQAPSSASPTPSSVVEGGDAGSGRIVGVVVSEESIPLAGVDVSTTKPVTLSARTDEAGRFEFQRLVAGTYTVFVQRLGFESAGRNVDVKEGEVAELRFTLKSVALSVPRNTTVELKGYWMCHMPIGPFVVNCEDAMQFTAPRADTVSFDVDKEWNTTVFELTWTHSGPYPDTVPAVYCLTFVQKKGATGQSFFGETHAKAKPMRHEFRPGESLPGSTPTWPEEPHKHFMNCYPKGLYNQETSTRGAGLVVDQRWTAWASAFYLEGPPKGFSAIP